VDEKAMLYMDSLVIDSSAFIRAAAFRGKERIGRITGKSVLIHKAAGSTPALKNPASGQYGSSEGTCLTDCLRASTRLSGGKWAAFEGSDLIATLDLREQKQVSHVTLSCLERQSDRIFLPRKTEVLVSDDGIDFHLIGSADNPVVEQPESKISELTVSFPVNTIRFMRIHAFNPGICPGWHPEAGKKTWLFADEIIVE
jgi:hexosaminidase